jgi:hypothetical protein
MPQCHSGELSLTIPGEGPLDNTTHEGSLDPRPWCRACHQLAQRLPRRLAAGCGEEKASHHMGYDPYQLFVA